MKRTWMIVLFVVMLPLAAFAQNTYLTTGFDGSPNSFFPTSVLDEHIALLTPSSAVFTVDSARFMFYRGMAGGATSLTFRIIFYAPDGRAEGDCGCDTGPETVLWTSANITVSGTDFYPNYFKVNINPNLAITGPFLMGVEYVSIAGGTAWPSLLSDGTENQPPCCSQYWDADGATIYDNQSYWTTAPGWLYMAVYGVGSGAALPGQLVVSNLGSMGGAVVDSTVEDTLIFGNSGGTTLTITNIASSNADFYTDPIGAGIVVAPGGSAKLAMHFTPSVAGDATTTLTFTDDVPASELTLRDFTGRGISTTNLMLFENWWNGNGYEGGWPLYQFQDAIDSVQWTLYYTGTHTGGYTNVWAQHDYSAAADTVLDIIGTPQMVAPVGGSVAISFRERCAYATDYYMGHYLALADSDTTWTILNEMPWAFDGSWGDYPTTYYVTGLTDTFSLFQLGFTYYGSDADVWMLDDILIVDVPQTPPFVTSDPRGDAFATDQELTAYVWDANSDAITVTAYVSAGGGPVLPFAMTETVAGNDTFCVPFTAFVDGSGSYAYYLEAVDNDGTTRYPETGSYTFEVVAQTGASEMVYHDGTWNNAHYYNDFADEEAVRFTPAAYPFQLTGAKVGILHGFPDVAHQQLEIKVYDDNGTDGLPGTLLYTTLTGSIGNECNGLGTSYALYYAAVVIDPNLVINDGTFYIAVKNPNDAVVGQTEAWTLDTLGGPPVSTYYYDATTTTWAAETEADGDAMISALGYSAPAPVVLTVYPNLTNTAANIFVNGVTGAISPTNIWVSSSFNGTQTLLPGSPFTTSPVSYTYTPASGGTFFSAKATNGPIDLLRQVPPTEPDYPMAMASSALPTNVPVVSASALANTVDLNVAPAKAVNFDSPTVIAVNSATGEKRVSTPIRELGKAHTVRTAAAASMNRGPVRKSVPMRDSFQLNPNGF